MYRWDYKITAKKRKAHYTFLLLKLFISVKVVLVLKHIYCKHTSYENNDHSVT